MNAKVNDILRGHFTVPAHIKAIAGAISYDLMHGPSFLLIPGNDVTRISPDCVASLYQDLAEDCDTAAGDVIEETYTGTAAQALRDYIDTLPSEVWVDIDCDAVMEREPEGCWTPAEDIGLEPNDDGEVPGYETDGNGHVWEEPYMEFTYHCDASDIVAALFGRTIAHEFN
jgi:hypothetical protein